MDNICIGVMCFGIILMMPIVVAALGISFDTAE